MIEYKLFCQSYFSGEWFFMLCLNSLYSQDINKWDLNVLYLKIVKLQSSL